MINDCYFFSHNASCLKFIILSYLSFFFWPEHVDVRTDDPTQPGWHGGRPHPNIPHAGGEQLGREDVDRPVAGGDGELPQHGESDEEPGLVPGDEDGDGEDQAGEQHTAGQCQASPDPAVLSLHFSGQ